ncbi:MAG: MFS transporter [Chloroflexi bacterium]|nr:MFS transporter [Chloroflexota bacterium]
MREELRQHVRHNFAVNVTDAGFYGLGLSFASFSTILPLFVSTLTDSTLLIGMIGAIHSIGWFFPQLLTAKSVAQLPRFRPMVLKMTLNERIPYFLLALVAWLAVGVLNRELALILTFLIIMWQAFGAGLTATAWQSMVAKIMPDNMRGTFYGTQSGLANLTGIGGAVLSGIILQTLPSPLDFTLCFIICGIAMMLSFAFLALTREPAIEPPKEMTMSWGAYWHKLMTILRENANFRWFIVARIIGQVGVVGAAFYTIHVVRHFGVAEGTVGVMAGVLSLAVTVATPFFGWLGDRYSHRAAFAVGMLLAGASAFIAFIAPSAEWFYLVFALMGAANGALWTSPMALNVEFCSESERPYYIGLASTLVAPMSLIAPIAAGLLADSTGIPTTFVLATVGALITAAVVAFVVREPRHILSPVQPTYAAQAMD